MVVELYKQHVAEKMQRFQEILQATGFGELVIGSGETKMQFQDDMPYSFKANPYFREWAPLATRAGCYLQIIAGASKPRLFLLTAEDIWHTAPESLPPGFEQSFEIIEYETVDEVKKCLGANAAFINETNTLEAVAEHWNPQAVIHQIDYQRRGKTPYEQESVREANRRAAPAHRAAQQAFMAGASEVQIAAAYLAGCDSRESEMPYGIIAGVNEHAAVLHHHNLFKQPQTPRSFLIDAGVEVYGYASDITRTYAYDSGSDFAAMIELMDVKQLELCAEGGIGKSPVDIHVLSQHKIAEVLIEFGVLNMSAEEAVANDIAGSFYPHGLGHHLGCNVHDKGGQLANAQGDILPPPAKYPKLRSGAPMVANQIHTVEPGLYFIPAYLDKLKAGEYAGSINWSRVDEFVPYGGIRIEDNIIVHADGSLENLTRDAFAGMQQ
ncbi:Xaa-Pro dipeptidase [Porticoccaceae bacterium]|jgi:Xaa-Pro dipeptidase|nr:Xaa-Pro dipeptidase [Porticoccaceae bacterium]MDC1477122.1 Xaa-Pro dipeptidase [Porticoccaceae bacterium]CAI8294681.1 MAG: Xaa-Pro dipeptidase [SAR92 bacterium MED-G29]|tara:strand:+ start:9291 stop:10604 length:1314 start_codon:yes stop_codon:yes gene_type:complete